MAKATPTTVPAVATPTIAPATLAAAKQVRYAPAAAINLTAVITHHTPQAKGPSAKSKSAARYNTFYQNGITVAAFIASYKAAGLKTTLARADLRWDLQHGLITLG